MSFPGSASSGLRALRPLLFTANGAAAVPSNARVIHAFLVGGGGGGGVKNTTASTACGAAGGGGGGSVYVRVNARTFRGDLRPSASLSLVTLGVGAGGVSNTVSTNTSGNGGIGGNSSFTLTGGLSVTVGGGGGGSTTATTLSAGGGGGETLAAPASIVIQTYYQATKSADDAVLVRDFAGAPQSTLDAFTGMSSGCAGGALTATLSSESVSNGGVVSSVMILPWWVQAVGITSIGTRGTNANAGAGTGHVATHGGGGFNGASGSGAASNTVGATASAGTGYGSGGGGASGVGTNTSTSGAGAPGCVVIMFEVED